MSYSSRRGNGPPAWFIFLLAVAFIFGLYYLLAGFQNYLTTGGLSVAEATEMSAFDVTSTAVRDSALLAELPTRRPTSTPKPPCQEFEVIVSSAIVRREPTTNSPMAGVLEEGSVVCVLERAAGTDWYLIDRDAITRRIETGYMRQDLIRALNPTPTPSNTPIPPPTITTTYTPSPTRTPTPGPTNTPDPNSTPTLTLTPTPTVTPPAVSL